MDSVTIFWMQIIASTSIFGLIGFWYVRPYLLTLPRYSALIPLLFVHTFRYVGMTLLVTGMIDPKLTKDFLFNTAYGDLLEAALALAAIFALRGNWSFAIPMVWVANTFGFVDLLNAVRSVLVINFPSFNLGTIWYIYVFFGPLVIVSHLMIFWVLLKPKMWKD